MCKLFNDVPKTLLKEHYRCHPKIIDFCNKKFYDNQLIILTNENSCDSPLEVYKIFDLLYSSYSEKLIEFFKMHKKVSK
ncbi:AAA domain-containing protein, partial [Clostridium sp. LS]